MNANSPRRRPMDHAGSRHVGQRRSPHERPGPGGTGPGDIRCRACGALLARFRDDAVTIERGDYEAAFEVDDHLLCRLRCYMRWCRTLNVVHVSRRSVEVEPA